ncbi:MAG: NTP transferase domain-containing protein [Ignavibacteriae bacterium]|nr:NTP transferase domain-containing protein [Ignavibacteriota bacterium]
MDRNIIILAGGASSRMKKSASAAGVDETIAREIERKTKAMLSVGQGGRPFLDFLLFNIEQAGYRQVVIIVGDHDDSIRSYYEHEQKAGSFPHLTFKFVTQKIPTERQKPLGTADAVVQALHALPEWRGQQFTVCNADNLYSVAALRLLLEDSHEGAVIDYERSALSFPEERISQFAITMKDESGFLSDIIEKPSLDELARAKDASGRIGVSMNIWRFTYDRILPFVERLPLHPVRQEKELPLAVKAMVTEYPRSVFAIPLAEHVIDLTSGEDIPAVQKYLRDEFQSTHR